MSKKPFNRFGKTKKAHAHRCDRCVHYFMPEEVRVNRFIVDRGMCARCIALEDMERGDLEKPRCFGISHNAGNPLCTQVCKLRQACLIQFSDKHSTSWTESEIRTRGTQVECAARVLRALAMPIHKFDLAPILNRYTNNGFKLSKNWRYQIVRILKDAEEMDIIALGRGFFVWAGAWNPDDDEIFKKSIDYDRRKPLEPLGATEADLEEYEDFLLPS